MMSLKLFGAKYNGMTLTETVDPNWKGMRLVIHGHKNWKLIIMKIWNECLVCSHPFYFSNRKITRILVLLLDDGFIEGTMRFGFLR